MKKTRSSEMIEYRNIIMNEICQSKELVKLLGKPKKEEKPKEEEKDLSFIFKDLEERMKQVMGTKVIINKKDRNKGRVEIEYYSETELERIVELIESIKE